MQPITERIVSDALSIWRFRWYGVAAAWIVAVAGCVFVWTQPNTYQARARIFVDTETVLKPLLAGLAVGTDERSKISMMSAIVMSRPNLDKVARQTDLYLRTKNDEQREALLAGLAKTIELKPERDGTFTLSYSDPNRALAQRVVQTLLNTFVEDTLGFRRTDTTTAQRFIEQQISEYESRLRAAEERLADFKRRNVGLMPGESGGYYENMQASMTALSDMRGKLLQLTSRKAELERQLEGEEPTFGIVTPTRKQGPNAAKIKALEAQIDQLLMRYTEKHPDVIAAREMIERLKNEKDAGDPGPAIDPQTAAMRSLDINPVYQSIRVSLSQTNAEIAELRGQIAMREAQVGQLRGRVNSATDIEAQLAQLNRDYEVNKAQYTSLVQRLESARLSDKADQTREDVKFRIIEPPVAPLLPTGPNRPLLFGMVLAAALGVGAFLAFALHLIRPVFSTRASVREFTGRPVLGSITDLSDMIPVAWFRRQGVLVSGASAVLVLAVVGNILFATR